MANGVIVGEYRQKAAERFTEADGLPGKRVQALCIDARARVWVGTESGTAVRSGGKWKKFGKGSGLKSLDIRVLIPGDGFGVMAATADGISVYKERGGWKSVSIPTPGADGGPRALARYPGGGLWLATDKRLMFLASGADGFEPISCPFPGPRNLSISAMQLAPDGALWVSSNNGFAILNHGEWRLYDDDNPDSGLLYYQVGDLDLDSWGNAWLATRLGLIIYDGMDTWHRIAGPEGLPIRELNQVSLGADGFRWFGSALGALCLKGNEWEYFAGRRWLPSDEILSLAATDNGEAWIGTTAGVSYIRRIPMTLERKSDYCHKMMDKHFKRRGFTTELDLKKPGDLNGAVKEATDNDGLWTSMYLAAECFRYAVTGAKSAKKNARESLDAMLDLERLSTIDGYMARALVKKGEKGVRKSGGTWYPSADGKWEWKADTSSDEVTGHYFVYPIYCDLVANAGERKEIVRVVSRMTDHFLENDFKLVDKYTGRRTTWGVFSPKYLNSQSWEWQRRLNCLEILAAFKSACYLVGDQRYEQAYRSLAREYHYAINMINQKITIPQRINNSDDELAFLAYYSLVLYEKDPDLQALYRMSLDRSWRIDRPERNSLWNAIYGAVTGELCDMEGAVRTLRELPLDPVRWDMKNSHRRDLDYRGVKLPANDLKSTDVLPYDERPSMRWNGNPFAIDGGHGGRKALSFCHYLLPYWMARHHKLIIEE